MILLAGIFDMGEHAAFIWSALGVTIAVMLLLLLQSWRAARSKAREWEHLRAQTRDMRGSADESEA